jgi:hypothetical protein
VLLHCCIAPRVFCANPKSRAFWLGGGSAGRPLRGHFAAASRPQRRPTSWPRGHPEAMRGWSSAQARLMEAVELRKNQLAVLLVLGSCGLRWLPGACSED